MTAHSGRAPWWQVPGAPGTCLPRVGIRVRRVKPPGARARAGTKPEGQAGDLRPGAAGCQGVGAPSAWGETVPGNDPPAPPRSSSEIPHRPLPGPSGLPPPSQPLHLRSGLGPSAPKWVLPLVSGLCWSGIRHVAPQLCPPAPWPLCQEPPWRPSPETETESPQRGERG